MATINQDYLDSLPADERAEFLNTVYNTTLAFEMLSMNPSPNDIMVQNIRGLYKDYKGTLIKCTFCRKDEPDDQEFGGRYI